MRVPNFCFRFHAWQAGRCPVYLRVVHALGQAADPSPRSGVSGTTPATPSAHRASRPTSGSSKAPGFRRARTGSTPHRCHSANNSPAKLWCSISGLIVASTASTFSPTSSSWRNASPGIRWHSSVCSAALKTKRSPRTSRRGPALRDRPSGRERRRDANVASGRRA